MFMFKVNAAETLCKYLNLARFRWRSIHTISEGDVVRSKLSDVTITKKFLHEYIWDGLDKWHDKTAVICAETRRSYLYSDLYNQSRALVNFLHKFPCLNQNDIVAVVLPNIPEYPIIILGAFQAGLIVSTVNPDFTSDEIKRQFSSCKPKLIFTLAKYYQKVNKVTSELKSNIQVIVIDDKDTPTPEKTIKFSETISGSRQVEFRLEKNYDNVILLPYSSGTTGVPKGVQLTNMNLVSNLYQINSEGVAIHKTTEGTYQEAVPVILPLYHMYGLQLILLNLLASGCKLITIPKFGTEIFFKVLKEFRPTILHLVPPLVTFLINNEQLLPEYLINTKTILSAAAPLRAGDIEMARNKFDSKINILQAYGLSETCSLTHMQIPNLVGGVKTGGSGLLVPNTECKIVTKEEPNLTLGPNQSGEIVIKGPQVMKCYHDSPEATANVFDSNGWFKTGDIGHYDEDGHLFVTDRLKELIKVKGFQVAPAELEEVLRGHSDIEDAAVLGVPHDAFGEVPKAFIVLRKNSRVNLLNVEEYVRAKVAPYKNLVGGIVIIDAIPKTSSGKILRRQLKLL